MYTNRCPVKLKFYFKTHCHGRSKMTINSRHQFTKFCSKVKLEMRYRHGQPPLSSRSKSSAQNVLLRAFLGAINTSEKLYKRPALLTCPLRSQPTSVKRTSSQRLRKPSDPFYFIFGRGKN